MAEYRYQGSETELINRLKGTQTLGPPDIGQLGFFTVFSVGRSFCVLLYGA